MEKILNRNQFVDIMRGFAMILVVLGHTMTGCTLNSESSFLFNVIWSLQMPLFILISGYVTRYSREVSDFKGLCVYMWRRTVAYILPWIVWSIGIRGILFGETNFLNIRFMLWHMDSGYWFLPTIWTINLIFGISLFCTKKITNKTGVKQQIVMAVIYVIGMCGLLGLGLIFGMTFFAIKLTLYYMPFYFVGYLYGQYEDKIKNMKNGKVLMDIVIASSLFIWLYAILRYSVYNMSDSGLEIAIRGFISLTGCIAVCGLCNRFLRKSFLGWDSLDGNGDSIYNRQQCVEKNSYSKNAIESFFYWFGKHSLEVYLLHGLFLNILKTKELHLFSSIIGYGLTFGNYILTLLLCYIVITFLRKCDLLKKILCLR